MIDISTIGIKVDSKSVKKGTKDLNQLGKQSAKTEQNVTTATGKMNQGFSSSMRMIKGLVAAAGVMATVRFFGGAIREAAQFERNMNVINNLVKQTGADAWTSGERLKEQARQMGFATLESVEGIMAAQQTMLTFRNVTGEAFDRSIQAAADMSAALGVDLKSSTLQLGKALEDPITGMTALTRSGTVFTDQQKDMVRAMVEAGDTALAQSFILSELEAQYGGSATAAAEGLAGSLDTLAQRWQEFKINLMEDESGALTAVIDGIASTIVFLEKIVKSVSIAFSDMGQAIGANAAALTRLIKFDKQGADAILAQRELQAKKNEEILNDIWEEGEGERKITAIKREKIKATEDEITALQRYQELSKQMKETGTDSPTGDAQKIREQNEQKFLAMQEGFYTEMEIINLQEQEKMMLLQDHFMQSEMTWEEHEHVKTQIEQEGAAARLAIAQAEKNQKLGFFSEMFGNLSQLMITGSKKLFNIGKASAIGQTVIDTYMGAQKIFASLAHMGPVVAGAGAAAAGAAGMARVQSIRSQSFGSGGVSSAPASGGVSVGGGEPVTTQAPQQARPQQDLVIQRTSSSRWTDEEVESLFDKVADYTRDNDIALGRIGFA